MSSNPTNRDASSNPVPTNPYPSPQPMRIRQYRLVPYNGGTTTTSYRLVGYYLSSPRRFMPQPHPAFTRRLEEIQARQRNLRRPIRIAPRPTTQRPHPHPIPLTDMERQRLLSTGIHLSKNYMPCPGDKDPAKEGERCAIFLETFAACDRVIHLPCCGNKLHHRCAQGLLTVHCPLCRGDIRQVIPPFSISTPFIFFMFKVSTPGNLIASAESQSVPPPMIIYEFFLFHFGVLMHINFY
jgi:hypothetical protein